jgi:hypothetical protein
MMGAADTKPKHDSRGLLHYHPDPVAPFERPGINDYGIGARSHEPLSGLPHYRWQSRWLTRHHQPCHSTYL